MLDIASLTFTALTSCDNGTAMTVYGPLTETCRLPRAAASSSTQRRSQSENTYIAQPGEYIVLDYDGAARRYTAAEFALRFV